MYTYIYMVSHGHSEYSPYEVNTELSQDCIYSIKQVTERLMRENIDVIISSPYKRAFQTVRGLAKQLNIPVEINGGFKERALGLKPVEDFNDAIRMLWNNENTNFEGWESNSFVQKRCVDALENTINLYEGKKIVVGTHDNIMALTLNYYDKKYDYDFLKKLSKPYIYKITFHKNKFYNAKKISLSTF